MTEEKIPHSLGLRKLSKNGRADSRGEPVSPRVFIDGMKFSSFVTIDCS